MTPRIAVAVLYGERVLGDALAEALTEAGFEVSLVGSERDVFQFAECNADIIVLQGEPREEVSLTVQRILEVSPKSKIIVVGLADGDPAVLACFEAGVRGHIGKDQSLFDLIAAIKAVARGETACSPGTTFALFERLKYLARAHEVSLDDALSARELKIVALVGSGMSNREIASTLNLSRHTVKNHIHHILEKLRVPSRADAVRFAIDHGLIHRQRDS